MSQSQTQYLRQCSIILAGNSNGPVAAAAIASGSTTSTESGGTGVVAGSGIDVSALRCQFSVRRGDLQTPNSVDLRIFNLSDQTANRIQKEFSMISISAGYPGNVGLVFRGGIKQVRKGRIDQKDSYVDVTAADGDEAYNFAPISLSVIAGTSPTGVAKYLFDALSAKAGAQSIAQGYQPNFPQNGSVRGQVFYGMVKDSLREFANSNNCAWSIQDGELTFIPLTSYIPAPVIVLSPTTGLIGVPEQTQQGVHCRMLLNPNIKIGQTVQIVGGINQVRLPLGVTNGDILNNQQALQAQLKTNGAGLYYVMVANHTGDTRGQEWYTDITCLAVDATVPINQAPNALTVASAESIPIYSQ